jgi:membrane dipeptidase
VDKMDYLDLHLKSLVVDTHCDTLKCILPIFTRPRDSMWDDRSELGLGTRSTIGHLDIPRLKEGGVNCQVFAISSERNRFPSHPLRTALEMIECFYREAEINNEVFVPVTHYQEIIDAKKNEKVAAMLSIEGADVLKGKIDIIGIFHKLGVRMIGLVHSLRNQIADGVTDRRTEGGLTEFGVQVVEELERIGIIIDVSHLNDEGFWDVINLTNKPLIASHSNSRLICDHPRNLTDDQIKAIAEVGGVMGLNFAPNFINPTLATVHGLVDHIGLGSDFDGIPNTPIGLEDVTKISNITLELIKRQYSVEDIKKILGDNHLRLIKKIAG